jgi:hypothetical protein
MIGTNYHDTAWIKQSASGSNPREFTEEEKTAALVSTQIWPAFIDEDYL